MKIAYIANARIPTEKAHGIQIMKTCEAFARAGHDVTLVVPARKNVIPDDPFAYYGAAPLFRIVPCATSDPLKFGRVGFLFAALYFAERARWTRAFREADVIYSRDAVILFQYLLLGRSYIYEAHGAPTFTGRIIARFAHRIVVISKGVGDAFASRGISREKIVVAPDAVDLDAFAHPESKAAARTRLGLPQDKRIVLYVGRLDGWKGAETLCEAAARLPDDVQVVVIGGEVEQVTQFAQRYPKVRFLGFRPYRELADNQAAADVLVLPNTGKSEISMRYTSPLKLFTYMASGVPVVASDTPATREILTDDDAYFFTPDDARALSEQVVVALGDSKGSAMKAHHAALSVQEYSWGKRAGRILDTL